MYVVDILSETISYILGNKGKFIVGRIFRLKGNFVLHPKNLTVGDVGISTITLAELQYGIEKSSTSEKNKEALEKFLTQLIVDFDYEATIEYGKIRASLEKKGGSYWGFGYADSFSCKESQCNYGN